MEALLEGAAPQSSKLGETPKPEGGSKAGPEKAEACLKQEARKEDPTGDGVPEQGELAAGTPETRCSPPTPQADHRPRRRGAPRKRRTLKKAAASTEPEPEEAAERGGSGPSKPWKWGLR